MEGRAAPGASRVPFFSYWVGDSMSACHWVAQWDGGWEVSREDGCRRIGSWLGELYTESVPEAGVFEEEVDWE